MENAFLVDLQKTYLMHVNNGHLLPYSVKCIISVSIIEAEKLLEHGEILLIIEASKLYFSYMRCFFTEQSARLPTHKYWDHQIFPQDPKAKIPTGAIYKTILAEDEGLRK